MKVVVFNGSPRKNGDTAKMSSVFKEAAEKAGHDVKVFDVANMNINGCKGCEYCHQKSDGICIQHDDMDLMYDDLREAEVLILASPIYYFAMSGQIQTALNRTYCIGRFPKLKKLGMILSSHDSKAFGACKAQHDDLCRYLELDSAGLITSHQEEHSTEAKLAEVTQMAENL